MNLLLAVLLLTALSEVNSCKAKCSRVVCYYVIGAADLNLEFFPADLCTHVVVSHVSVSKNHDLITPITHSQTAPTTDFIELKGNLKTLIAVQNDESFDVFVKMYTSESSRQKFAVKLRQTLNARGLDGVKIDEQLHPGGNREEFTNLIKDIAKEFHKQYILTVGIPTNITFLEHYYDIPSLSKHADMLDLASYHFTVPTITEDPQHHSPLKNKDKYSTQSIEYLAKYVLMKGADPRKVNVGLSTMKYVYKPENGGPYYLEKIDSYDRHCGDLKLLYEKVGVLDPEGGIITKNRSMDGKSSVVEIYDDEESLRKKVNFILHYDYGGVVVKGLNYDDILGYSCRLEKERGRYPLLHAIRSACGL